MIPGLFGVIFAICPYSSATILEGQCVEILEESGVYLVVTPVDKK